MSGFLVQMARCLGASVSPGATPSGAPTSHVSLHPGRGHFRPQPYKGLRRSLSGLFAALACSQALAAIIPPGPNNGIEMLQLDMVFSGVSESRSDWGQITVDPSRLAQMTGIPRGYLNVFAPLEQGWIVYNLYLDGSDNLGPITRNFSFGLSAPAPVAVLNARIEYTPDPLDAMPAPGGEMNHPVAPGQYNAEGVGQMPNTAVGRPIPGGYYPQLAQLAGPTMRIVSLPNVVNVQAAQNQCFPMSIANSLQYLENRFPTLFTVPNNHTLGLRGDNSLVGRLDTLANRMAPNRLTGGGVWFTQMLQAKFGYLFTNNLANKLVHRHQGIGWGGAGNALPAGNFTAGGITSAYQGGLPTWQWITGELMQGADIEICWSYEDLNGVIHAGHAVRVFESGMTRGIPWLGYVHDSLQTGQGDPNDTRGLVTQREFVVDVDGDGFMNIGGRDREVRFAFSESVLIDCNSNGTQDAQDISSGRSRDCNANGTPDECDIASGTSRDCNHNGTIDACENLTDCNFNGTPDVCEPHTDCNANGIPDFCEPGGNQDCNQNGIPDLCEPYTDCNTNGVRDTCEPGGRTDCNHNGIPDFCELAMRDCNMNSTPDDCDIASGAERDANSNGIPDSCEITEIDCPGGDMNRDGSLDADDIGGFVAVYTGADANAGRVCQADVNASGALDANDMQRFVSQLLRGGATPAQEWTEGKLFLCHRSTQPEHIVVSGQGHRTARVRAAATDGTPSECEIRVVLNPGSFQPITFTVAPGHDIAIPVGPNGSVDVYCGGTMTARCRYSYVNAPAGG